MMSNMKWLCGMLALTMVGVVTPACGPSQTIDLRDDAGEDRDVGEDADTDLDTSEDPDTDPNPDTDVDPDTDDDADSGEDADTGEDPADLSDAEAAARALVAGMCQAVWSCSDTSQSVAFLGREFGRYLDLETCIASWRDGGGAMDISPIVRGVEEGRIVVTREQLDACSDAFEIALCEGDDTGGPQGFAIPAECQSAMEGQVQLDASCAHAQECASGLRCDMGYEVDSPCYGTCVDPAVADACGSDGLCGDDAYCDRQVDPPQCVDYEIGDECTEGGGECETDYECIRGTCQYIPEPEPIVLASEGETCSFFEQIFCEPGFTCRTSFTAEGLPEGDSTCERAGVADDFCTSNVECRPGLRCAAQNEGPSVCGALLPLDEACEESGECESRYCEYDFSSGSGGGTCSVREVCEIPG